MVADRITIFHLSDIHFGRDVSLGQVTGLEELAVKAQPDAIAIAGDLTQRARHGEFQRALVFVEAMRRVAPTLVVPGNHDIEWWTTPFDVVGAGPKYEKYSRYFGEDLTPKIVVDGAVLCGALSSHGVVAGSMTYNLNDMAVKGHLPASETERVGARFLAESPELLRVMVMHQNLLRGEISQRMGLARWHRSWRAVMETGVDLVLCGHDHQERCGTLPNGAVVATSGTHTARTRGGRPSACNIVTATRDTIVVQHWIWNQAAEAFEPGPTQEFPRVRVP